MKCCRLVLSVMAILALFGRTVLAAEQAEWRRLSVQEYRDKMKAGWVGQMAAVAWGYPTEFKFHDKIIPEDSVPVWDEAMINDAFNQDDLYVEMTFLRTLEQYGLDCSIRQAGIDFANSRYMLWCANAAARNNLRLGIAPPDSGHPAFSRCSNDIDYQIEADYAGLIAPGLPQMVVALGDKFGRLMNYSDGIYGGIFMGGMYTEAFFTDDIQQIIGSGLACIPPDSQYAEMVRDLVQWHREHPDDWQKTWQLCQKKYRENPTYQQYSNGGEDVKINGAYVLLGLLYGHGDPDQTIIISMRAGQDSDCNPSSAAGVLFTTRGFAALPERFSRALKEESVFSFTSYNIPGLLDVCERLTKQCVLASGGRVETDASGEDMLVIPVKKPTPLPLELSWAPGPIAVSRYTSDEMAKIELPHYNFARIHEGVASLFPGWTLANCGSEMTPGVRDFRGHFVLVTHPLSRETPCVLSRDMAIPADGTTTLHLTVGCHEPKQSGWELVVRIDGETIFTHQILHMRTGQRFISVSIDLTPWAGKTIMLELQNKADGWNREAAYWERIAIETK